MNFRDYWDHVGTDNITQVLHEAEVDIRVAYQYRSGLRTPSGGTAIRIINAAEKLTPGWVPSLRLLLSGIEPSGSGRKILPSAKFLADQRRRLTRKAKKA